MWLSVHSDFLIAGQGLPFETVLCEIPVLSVTNKQWESWNSSSYFTAELKIAKSFIVCKCLACQNMTVQHADVVCICIIVN